MIIVMSDSHGETAAIRDIKAHYGQSDLFIHCGDSELPANHTLWQGISAVAGNCDFDPDFPSHQILQTDIGKVFVTHGHLLNVNFGLGELSETAQKYGASIALFGHIHQPVAQLIDGVLCLNPGSLSQPRGEWPIKMYAVIESDKKHYHISYRDLNHHAIAGLQITLSLDPGEPS